jgi:uncharacterized protein DUF4238
MDHRMPKRRHHFVPRFYLGQFLSEPRRIHILNLSTSRVIQNASLRDQCQSHRLYVSDEIEDALATMEAGAARVIRDISKAGELPTAGSDDEVTLRAFVTFQLLRTPAAAERLNAFADKVTKQAHAGDPRVSGVDLDTVKFGFDHAVLLAMTAVPRILVAIADLKSHLLDSGDGRFITSDSPAVKYNKYCEGIECHGLTGAAARGLQVFFPLTARSCLLLYDGGIYSVLGPDRKTRRSVCADGDVAAINRMQLVFADQNVYFSRWDDADALQELLQSVKAQRQADRTVVAEYGHDTDSQRSLIVSFERMPNIALNLSLMRVRWRPRSVSLHDRIRPDRAYRPGATLPPERDYPEPPYDGPATFSRFIGRR